MIRVRDRYIAKRPLDPISSLLWCTPCQSFQMSQLQSPADAIEGDGAVQLNVHDLRFGYDPNVQKVRTKDFLEHSKHVVGIIGIESQRLNSIRSNE